MYGGEVRGIDGTDPRVQGQGTVRVQLCYGPGP